MILTGMRSGLTFPTILGSGPVSSIKAVDVAAEPIRLRRAPGALDPDSTAMHATDACRLCSPDERKKQLCVSSAWTRARVHHNAACSHTFVAPHARPPINHPEAPAVCIQRQGAVTTHVLEAVAGRSAACAKVHRCDALARHPS